jgi:hypothetical protein
MSAQGAGVADYALGVDASLRWHDGQGRRAMSALQILEVVAALALIGWGIWSYRRGGTQGGVIVMIVGLLVLVHGLGLMEYRPSSAELEQL